MQNKRSKIQTIRVKTSRFNADGLNFSSIADNRTDKMIKFGMYGLFIGIGYGLFTKTNVLYSMLVGTLLGTITGNVMDKITDKNKTQQLNTTTQNG